MLRKLSTHGAPQNVGSGEEHAPRLVVLLLLQIPLTCCCTLGCQQTFADGDKELNVGIADPGGTIFVA